MPRNSENSNPTDDSEEPIEVTPLSRLGTLLSAFQQAIKKQDEPDVFEQPTGSRVQFEQFTDGISIHSPPCGLKNSALQIYRFGQFFTAIVACIAVIGIGVTLAQPREAFAALTIIPIVLVFLAIGLLMIRHGQRVASRETGIAVLDGKLVIFQSTFGKIKRWEHRLEDIVTVRCGPSSVEINDEPVYELQFIGAHGKLLGLLSELDRQELRWMATLLRQSIAALPQSAESAPLQGQQTLESNPAPPENESSDDF